MTIHRDDAVISLPSLTVPFFIPHAGCPHTCVFCNQKLISGQSGNLPSADEIRDTVKQWVSRSPGRSTEVAFFGGSFTLLPIEQQTELLEAVQPLIKQQIVRAIRLSTRPDGLSDSVLSFLAAHGVQTIEIGVQSLDDDVLKSAGRGHTAADSLNAIKRSIKAGFRVGAQLLPGLPGDTPDKSMDSLRGVISSGAHFVRIYPALALSNTTLAARYLAGEWKPPTLYEATLLAARMLLMAMQANIPVIRLGLQSDETLNRDGSVLAGPWHPAFGQLARGELYYSLVCAMASQAAMPVLRISCHPTRVSDVTGHGRNNVIRWQQNGFFADTIIVTDESLLPEELLLETACGSVKGSILTTLHDEEMLHAQRIT